MKNFNLSAFEASKLNVDELLNAKGGFGNTITRGASTTCGSGDADCGNRDCDNNEEVEAIQ